MAFTLFSEQDLMEDYWGCVQKIVQQRGNENFIVTTKGSLTYSGCNQRANAIYAAIRCWPGLHGNGIGLFLKDPLETIPSMMGVLKSGNYIVPLDVGFPKSTLESMIETAEVKAVLTNRSYFHQLKSVLGDELPVINLDDLDMDERIDDPRVQYSSRDVFQILFTSGSTGQPKGAIEDYRYLIRAVVNRLGQSYYDLDDRHLQLSTFTFSGPHIRVFTTLINGNSLYYYDLKEDGMAGLPKWIRLHGITFYSSTPTVFRSLTGMLDPQDIFPSVTKFSSGGEKKLHGDIQSVKRHFPNVKYIRVGFGSTETQNVTSSNFSIDHDFGQHNLPSGRPVRGVQVFIWDEHGRSMPAGEEGEIVVYSDSLVRGYINNPKLTQERFIPDPKNPDWQFFKTGDLGKLLPDGQLVHLGRIDNMIKIKGVRIEVDAIENLVLSYPGIVQVASRAVDGHSGAKRLATYFVPEAGITIPVSDLRKHLAEQLPRHLLPHYLIPLESLPIISGRGKVDRLQLPVPNMIRPELSNPFVPPSGEIENKLLRIWEAEIGIKGIGVTDDFFEVGGDSLIGVLLFVHIEKEFGRSLPVSILLTASTVQKQAELILTADQKNDFLHVIPIRQTGAFPPVFFIPGKGAYPTRVRHLAKKLDSRIPIFAMQYLESSDDGKNKNFTEYLASIYVDEIRKRFPHGPYLLVGESWGGKVAFEMARQFQKLGEDIPILALLDTYLNEVVNKSSPRWYTMIIKKHFSILFKADFQGKVDYLRFYYENGWRKFKQLAASFISLMKPKDFVPSSEDIALPFHLRELEERNNQASKLYKPLSYSGRVVLFKALRGSATKDESNGWNRVNLGELRIHSLDCYHGSILFEPAVSRVAAILQTYITQLDLESKDVHL